MKCLHHIILILPLSLLLSLSNLHAQHARFLSSGIIHYDKQVNMFAAISSRMINNDGRNSFGEEMYENYKSSQPQFKTFPYELSFSGDLSSFKPLEDPNKTVSDWNYLERDPVIDQKNTVYADLKKQTRLSKKNIYDEWFVVSDSLRPVRWKLTDEHREIAGYDCRRANGLTMDSVYVVAFYTDQIPVSGGPDSFHGLPGMILGLVMPHEHITFFATKINDQDVPAASITAPQEKKIISKPEFIKKMNDLFEDWRGNYTNTLRKAIFL
ncbi:GLPGLI family protein [bacterium A37T11]|nr:GLPGLI family protein [bacterium A37T11]